MADLTTAIDGLEGTILVAEEFQSLRYAFRSLNPRHVCIVDVDSFYVSEEDALDLLDAFVADHSSRWRAYRTHAGLRYIELSSLWYPRTHIVKELMLALSADPSYISASVLNFRPGGRETGTFAARIDPKPWNMVDGPTKIELRAMSDEDYAAYRTAYATAKMDYRVGELLDEYGDTGLDIHPWAQLVVDYHDVETRASEAGLPLA